MPKPKNLTALSAPSKDLQGLFDLDIRISAPKPSKNLPINTFAQTDLSDSCSRVPVVKDVKR